MVLIDLQMLIEPLYLIFDSLKTMYIKKQTRCTHINYETGLNEYKGKQGIKCLARYM